MKKNRFDILLVNDDGYDAEGIKLAKKMLDKYGDVTIVAPLYPMSATSTSITIKNTMEYQRINEYTYAIGGSPADCVAFGLSVLKNHNFDFVISGINHGYNISHDIMHSGTIGAANQSLILGKPCLAFSAEVGLINAEKLFDEAMKFILGKNLISNEYILNINFPSSREYRGIMLTRLAKMHEEVIFYNDNTKIKRSRNVEYEKDENSDYQALKNGFISITPLNYVTFDKAIYEKIKNN